MKAACLPQLQRKSIIGPGFDDAEEIHIAFHSSEKSISLQSLTHSEENISLLALSWFSSTGLEHNVILCMVSVQQVNYCNVVGKKP